MKNIFRFLDNNGVYNAIVPGDYRFKADAKCEIHRMIVSATTDGSDVELDNGIVIVLEEKGAETIITELPIKNHFDWSMYCFDTHFDRLESSGNFSLMARWSFFKSGKALKLNKDDEFTVRVRDHYKDATNQHFQIQGIYK